MIRVNLPQIEYFATAAETLSFTRAAEKLCVTQQAVSKGVQALEGELGVRLFERRMDGLALTEAGRRALRHAQAVVHEAAALAGAVHGEGEAAEGRTLRLGASDVVLGRGYVLPLDDVLAFERRFDGVRIEVVESTSDGCQDLLATGSVDVAVVAGRADCRRFRVRMLAKRRFVPFVGSAHPLAHRDRVFVADLAREQFIIPRGATASMAEICEAFYEAGAEVPAPEQFCVPDCSPQLMMEQVYRGDGVAFMRDSNLDRIDPERGKALAVEPADAFASRLSVATSRCREADPLLDAFVEHLVGLF